VLPLASRRFDTMKFTSGQRSRSDAMPSTVAVLQATTMMRVPDATRCAHDAMNASEDLVDRSLAVGRTGDVADVVQ